MVGYHSEKVHLMVGKKRCTSEWKAGMLLSTE